jgi:hypothetical protein
MDQRFIITLDESWFYRATNYEQIWFRPGDTSPERARHTIQDRKIMVTIARNPLGFSLIVALPRGRAFNVEYYPDNIFAALTRLQPGDDGRNLLFMLTMQGLTLLKNVERFTKKMNCSSLPIDPTHLISHHPIYFCSVMSRNVSRGWYFHHMRNYSMQLVKW